MIRLAALMTAFSCLGATQAFAGNFCLGGSGMTPLCIYDDIRTCEQSTEPPNTSCFLNPEAYLQYSGSSDYCVVTSTLVAQCLYVDRSQCSEEAARTGALCVDNKRQPEDNETNPFYYDPRVQ